MTFKEIVKRYNDLKDQSEMQWEKTSRGYSMAIMVGGRVKYSYDFTINFFEENYEPKAYCFVSEVIIPGKEVGDDYIETFADSTFDNVDDLFDYIQEWVEILSTERNKKFYL